MSEVITAENNPFFEQEAPQPASKSHKFVNFLQGLVILAFILILVYQFVATPNQVNGRSMLPNFVNNDLMLTNRLVQLFHGTAIGNALDLNYTYGDVVIVNTPQIPNEDFIVKRIVALAGDTIGVKDGYVYLNGEKLDESSYLPPERRTKAGNFLREGDEREVPPNHFAVLGDNRPESLDSRNSPIEFVPKSNLVGRVFIRFWPLDRFATIGRAQDTSTEFARSL